MTAAEQVFEILERPVPPTGTRRDVPDPSRIRASWSTTSGHATRADAVPALAA